MTFAIQNLEQASALGRWSSAEPQTPRASVRQSLASQLRLQSLSIATQISDDARALIEKRLGDLRRARVTDLALRVGDRVPRFGLGDSVLNESLKSGPVVLSFYLGEWSPFCTIALRAMSQWVHEFEQFDARVLAICPETTSPTIARAMSDALGYSVHSDTKNRLAGCFGVLTRFSSDIASIYRDLGFDVPLPLKHDDLFLPLPATFVIDGGRVIRYAFVDPDFRKRAEPDEILSALTYPH